MGTPEWEKGNVSADRSKHAAKGEKNKKILFGPTTTLSPLGPGAR
jgi:hypothetical protein